MPEDFLTLAVAIHAAIRTPQEGRFLVGVVRGVLISVNRGLAVVADNVHFDRESHDRFLLHPFFHLTAHTTSDPDRSSFSPLDFWRKLVLSRGDAGNSDPVTLADIARANNLPLPIGDIDDPELPQRLFLGGDPWSAVAILRARTRIIESILHHASIGAPVPCTRVSDEIRITEFRSPHYMHPEEPMAENGRGQHKHLLPTVGWWEGMQRLAHQKRNPATRTIP